MNQTVQRGPEFHSMGRFGEARDCYKRALYEDPTDYEIHHLLGVAFHQLGECSTAIKHFDCAIELNSGVSQIHSNRPETLRVLKRFDESGI